MIQHSNMKANTELECTHNHKAKTPKVIQLRHPKTWSSQTSMPPCTNTWQVLQHRNTIDKAYIWQKKNSKRKH